MIPMVSGSTLLPVFNPPQTLGGSAGYPVAEGTSLALSSPLKGNPLGLGRGDTLRDFKKKQKDMLKEKVLTTLNLLPLRPGREIFEHCFLWQHKKDGIYIIWILKQPF